MKKYIWFLLLIGISLPGMAKQVYGLDLSIGLKGGLNINRTKAPGLTYVYKTDPHVGLFLYLNKKRLGVQIESIWTQTSVVSDTSFRRIYDEYLNNITDSLEQGHFRFNMISIPLLLNIKVTQKVWLQFGPQFMGNVSMTDKNKVLQSGLNIIKKNNYNFISGIWIQLGGDSPSPKINAGLRYAMSLNDMDSLLKNSVWKTNMIQLHIGITY